MDPPEQNGTASVPVALHHLREHMYRLVVSQLFQDGYGPLGVSLATAFNFMEPPCPPSDELFQIVSQHIPKKKEIVDEMVAEKSIDLSLDSSVEITSPPLTVYEFAVQTANRGSVHSAAFSSSGRLVATGSQDGYIKIYDVEKMIQRGLDFQKLPPDQVEQVCYCYLNINIYS